MSIILFTLNTLIIDYWSIIINRSIVLIKIRIIEFIWATIIFVNFVFLEWMVWRKCLHFEWVKYAKKSKLFLWIKTKQNIWEDFMQSKRDFFHLEFLHRFLHYLLHQKWCLQHGMWRRLHGACLFKESQGNTQETNILECKVASFVYFSTFFIFVFFSSHGRLNLLVDSFEIPPLNYEVLINKSFAFQFSIAVVLIL